MQGNPAINTRTIDTEVAVQSGQTIVLGGLIEEDHQRKPQRRALPAAHPGPGRAVSAVHTDSLDRSETLVLITPTVVESTAKLERVSKEFSRKFRGLDPLRESAPEPQGSDDP